MRSKNPNSISSVIASGADPNKNSSIFSKRNVTQNQQNFVHYPQPPNSSKGRNYKRFSASMIAITPKREKIDNSYSNNANKNNNIAFQAAIDGTPPKNYIKSPTHSDVGMPKNHTESPFHMQQHHPKLSTSSTHKNLHSFGGNPLLD